MAGTGNGPVWTAPQFVTDEMVAITAKGDFALLVPDWDRLAYASDGSISEDAPWVLNSGTVNFQTQGIVAQNVVVIDGPRGSFPGGTKLYAVDSVSGNSCTLRMVGQQLNAGQPPSLSGSVSGISFYVPTLGPTIDEAVYDLKRRYRIDEAIYWRSSVWMYQGAEDAYRVLRDAVVFRALLDAYEFNSRGGDETGDWIRKLRRVEARLNEIYAQIEVRWGPYGTSAAPTNALGCRLSR